MEYTDSFLQKMRLIITGLVILAAMLIIWALFNIPGGSAEADSSSTAYEDQVLIVSDSDNAITVGMTSVINEVAQASRSFQRGANNTVDTIGRSLSATGNVLAQGGKTIGNGVVLGITTVGEGIGTSIGFVASTLTNGVVFVLQVPRNTIGFVTNSSAVSSVIRPAEHAPVPIIDPNSPALQEARTAMAAIEEATPSNSPAAAIWPINGSITTQFGVKHWPYQPTHTGLDISDGKRSGVTPIRPFKPGRVIETVISRNGLGNHIVVDHGSGVTSVYGHLASISVVPGQEVDSTSTLGTEGSTGVSTGTHLHFEIRVNGEAADPSQFISGRP